jgi:hypothetical protein
MTPTRLKSFHSISVPLAAAVLALVLYSSPARAQAAPPPAQPTPPAQPAAPSPVPVPSFVPLAEGYHFEVSVDAWSTLPSTMMYSDTETITTTAATSTTAAVTTTVTGTNIDFKQQLGLHNQWFPAFHVVIRPQEKQKIHFSFYPLYYKQTATLSAPINFNGQTFAAGDTVSSSLYWNEWQLGYEYDVLTFERGYVGALAGANFYAVSGQLADSAQSGTAGVHIPMPGLGAIGRYYLTERFSTTGSFMGYWLPGGDTSTHGHVINVELYGTVSISKYVALQGGYRLFDAAHHFNSPVNTGSFLINGGFIGGVFRY